MAFRMFRMFWICTVEFLKYLGSWGKDNHCERCKSAAQKAAGITTIVKIILRRFFGSAEFTLLEKSLQVQAIF